MKGWIVTTALSRELRSVQVTCKRLTGVLRGAFRCDYITQDYSGRFVPLKEVRSKGEVFKTKKAADAWALVKLMNQRESLAGQLADVEKNIAGIEHGRL